MKKTLKVKHTSIPVITSTIGSIYFCDLEEYTSLPASYEFEEDFRGKILDEFYLDKIISVSGGMGVMMRGINIYDRKVYAIKILKPDMSKEEFNDEKIAYTYLSKYPQCNDYIVCMYKAKKYIGKEPKEFSGNVKEAINKNPYISSKPSVRNVEHNYLYFQMELMDMDLSVFMRNMEKYHGVQWRMKYPGPIRKIFSDITEGLKVLHDQDVAHMDLKPENILIKFKNEAEKCNFFISPNEENVSAKIGDLGLVCSDSKSNKLPKCLPLVTIIYASPEIIRNWSRKNIYPTRQAKKADMWSLGMVLGIMLFGMDNIPILDDIGDFFDTKDEVGYMNAHYTFVNNPMKYNSWNHTYDERISNLFYNLIRYDYQDRPSADDVYNMMLILNNANLI